MVNISLTEGVFADNWKVALVRPLLKKPSLEQVPSNYRLVSNLSFISKVTEKAVLHQFNNYCNEHELFPDYPSAYRKDYSCETALVKIMNDLL